eukprot:7557012-Pyramimonas_sp.AAC.1
MRPGTIPHTPPLNPPAEEWRIRPRRRGAGSNDPARACSDAGAAPPSAGATHVARDQARPPRVR